MNDELLALLSEDPPDVEPADQFLTFSLGKDDFAMDIRMVREIIQYGPLTAVPLMPEFVRGVINLRGAVVPVIDFQARLGRPVAPVGKKTCIVIFDVQCEDERVELGLLVDEVCEVVDIANDSIEAPPSFGTQVRRDFIRGMSKIDNRFIVILDPEKAFDINEMALLCESSQSSVAV